jgi:hypothetical protein
MFFDSADALGNEKPSTLLAYRAGKWVHISRSMSAKACLR